MGRFSFLFHFWRAPFQSPVSPLARGRARRGLADVGRQRRRASRAPRAAARVPSPSATWRPSTVRVSLLGQPCRRHRGAHAVEFADALGTIEPRSRRPRSTIQRPSTVVGSAARGRPPSTPLPVDPRRLDTRPGLSANLRRRPAMHAAHEPTADRPTAARLAIGAPSSATARPVAVGERGKETVALAD